MDKNSLFLQIDTFIHNFSCMIVWPWRTHTHKHTDVMENVSVLLVSVPSSVPVCVLGLVGAVCGLVVLFPGRGACEWLFFCCGCRFCLQEFVSLLLPPCPWAGMGRVSVACSYCSFFYYYYYYYHFCAGLWLLAAGAGFGWVEELTCLFPVWRLLKEYTKFFLGGGERVCRISTQ